MRDTQSCTNILLRFAAENCQESPLYEHLCRQTATDERLLEIVRHTPIGQPVPNLFLAAVHYLLLSGTQHELATFYPSCGMATQAVENVFPAFRDFCLAHESAIRNLLATRRVQTNEVRRCSYLLPAFTHIARQTESRPLAIIDVGCSAGLNLIWDRYEYNYGNDKLAALASRVRITAELRGTVKPPIPQRPPTVASRVGVDLHVPDVTRPDEALWLRALIWPDQAERLVMLSAAIEELRPDPPQLFEGDGLALLPELIRAAPAGAFVCVVHCHTLNQFSSEQREAFSRTLVAESANRPVVEVSAEWISTPTTELRLHWWERGNVRTEHLANVDQHGRWIEWLVE